MFTKSKNTYFATPKDDLKDLVEIEVGDSKQADFFPQVKVCRWGNKDGTNEVNVSLRLVHDETAPVVKRIGERINWKGQKVEADFYDLPVSEDHPEGAHEFDVTLKEKPATNTLQFTLNTKGVEFYYQPPLTQAEIDDGVERPEHVIGSYAIYTSEEKVNYEGGKLYKSGKVGHIYRPRIEDANGVEVWGELNITGGLLTVTIPQAFLDSAVYPIRHAAGLTFGYTSAGATANTPAGNQANLAVDTAALAGAAASISIYGKRSVVGNANVKGALWKNSDKSLVAASGAITMTSTTAQWWSGAFTPSIEAIAYYVGAILESGFGEELYYDTAGAGTGGRHGANSYASPTNLGTITNDTLKYSVYVTYAALAGKFPPPPKWNQAIFRASNF